MLHESTNDLKRNARAVRAGLVLVAALSIVVGIGACGGSQSASASDGTGSVTVEAPAVTAVGTPIVSVVSILAGEDTTITEGYPHRLDVAVSGPAPAESQHLRARDAVELGEDRVVFHHQFTPAAEGIYALNATLAFSVCSGSRCTPIERELVWSVAASGDSGTP